MKTKNRVTLVLALAALAVMALINPVASYAADRPLFQLPFTCGQQWRLDTWGHAPALDMVREPDQRGTEGSLLIAPANGVVNQSYYHGNAGNLIQINHGGGWFTTYIHLQSRSVQQGQHVRRGQEIGRVGKTGPTSNGHPHLHFEQAIDSNGDGSASWGFSGSERVRSVFNGVEYGQSNNQTWRNVTSYNCDASAGGATQFADINGDGRDEIITIQPNGDVWAYHNVNGFGGYSGDQVSLVAKGFTDGVRTKFADINGDGPDEIITIHPNGDVWAYHNVNGFGGYRGDQVSLVAQGFVRP
jgi:hypothetical protein